MERWQAFNIFADMSARISPEQLVQLANEFGTPLYVYHAEKIKEQYSRLQSAFRTPGLIFTERFQKLMMQ